MIVAEWEQQVRSVGWAIIPEVIPKDRVDGVRESVLAAVERYRHTRPDAPANIGAISGMIHYEQCFAPYLAEPRLLALAQALLARIIHQP